MHKESHATLTPVSSTSRYRRAVPTIALILCLIPVLSGCSTPRRSAGMSLGTVKPHDGSTTKHSSSNASHAVSGEVKGSPNGFVHYTAAWKLITKQDADIVDTGTSNLSQSTLSGTHTSTPPPSTQQVSQVLKRIQPAMAELMIAAACSKDHFQFPQKKVCYTTPFPEFSRARDLAKVARVDAEDKIAHGNVSEGLEELLSTVRLGSDMKSSRLMIGGLVGFAIDAIAYRSLMQTIGNHGLSTADYIHVTKTLERIGAEDCSLKEILNGERSLTMDMLKTMSESEFQELQKDAIVFQDNGRRSSKVTRTTMIRNADHAFAIMIANCAKPYPIAVRLQIEDIVPSSDPATRSLLGIYVGGGVRDAGEKVLRDGLILMAALEGYKTEHGNYPSGLQELVGTYLTKLPTDPYTDGKPFIYRPQGSKYLLYSVGPDMKDDGGKFQPRFWTNQNIDTPNGDGVFAKNLDIWTKPVGANQGGMPRPSMMNMSGIGSFNQTNRR